MFADVDEMTEQGKFQHLCCTAATSKVHYGKRREVLPKYSGSRGGTAASWVAPGLGEGQYSGLDGLG
jgi:hypothetical protein